MASALHSLSRHYIVFSYHDKHRQLVLQIYEYLKGQNLPVWIDAVDGFDKENRKSVVENTSGMICFVTPMYETSKRCQQEIEFARNEGIPVVVCRLLPNWKPSGWLKKTIDEFSMVDLTDINAKNFQETVRKLQRKVVWILDNGRNSPLDSCVSVDIPLIDHSIVVDDADVVPLCDDAIDFQPMRAPIHHRLLPEQCRVCLSNRMACNEEYILINANNHLHLFDKSLTLVRSNNDVRIADSQLRDLHWCAKANSFLVLTSSEIYLLNPLTCKLSSIETMKLADRIEEFVSCTCSHEKLFLLTCRLNFRTFFYHEYILPTFRFRRKYKVQDLLGTSLLVQNGSFDKYNIREMTSIRYYQHQIVMIMQIASDWFVYRFHLRDQPVVVRAAILLEQRSRMTVLNPSHRWLLFNDCPSNSFVQIDVGSPKLLTVQQDDECVDSARGFIDLGRKIRSAALFGRSHLVFLIDHALVLYKL